jgi:hypothetical protein
VVRLKLLAVPLVNFLLVIDGSSSSYESEKKKKKKKKKKNQRRQAVSWNGVKSENLICVG